MTETKVRPWLWLALIVAAGAIFRLHDLHQVRWNIDEGFWTYGASMTVRHGVGWPEGWRQGFLSPLYTRLLVPFFLVFGSSIPVARHVTVAMGLAAVVLTYVLCLRCGYRTRVALLGALFVSLNGYFAFMNAHAQTDTLLVLLVLAYLLLATGRSRPGLLAPVFLALAMATKLTGVFAAAVVYFHDVFAPRGRSPGRRDWRSAAIAPAAGILLGALVFVAMYATHPVDFVRTWQTELSIRRSQSVIGFNPFAAEGFVRSAAFLWKAMPLTILLALVALVGMLRERSARHTLPLLWLAFGLAVVMFQNYQPPRYYLPVIPPLSIMAAWLVDECLRSKGRRLVRGAGAVAAVLTCLYGPVTGYAYRAGHRDTTGPDVTRWMDLNLAPDAGVMGITPYGCSANVRYYPQDLYAPNTFLDAGRARELRIGYVLFDDAEWRACSQRRGSGFESYLRQHYRFVKRIGTIEIWETGVAGGGSRRPATSRAPAPPRLPPPAPAAA